MVNMTFCELACDTVLSNWQTGKLNFDTCYIINICIVNASSAFGKLITCHACDVTLSVYPHRASLKNMPDHGGNRTYDLWNTSPMLCQLSYAVWSVRVCDISEQNLVPSISMLSNNNHDFSVLV